MDSNADQVAAKLPKLLARERERLGFSKRALSEQSGVSRAAIRMIEEGSRQPTVYTLKLLCEAMGVELWRLIREAEE